MIDNHPDFYPIAFTLNGCNGIRQRQTGVGLRDIYEVLKQQKNFRIFVTQLTYRSATRVVDQ